MYNLYECNKCKFSFISTNEHINCIKCNNKLNVKKVDEFEKLKVVPFKNIDLNKKLKKEKNYFLKTTKITNLNKIYVPVFITNFNMTGKLELEGVVETKINKYIKEDKYNIKTNGSVEYKDYLISISKLIDTKTLNNIGPFKLDKVTDEIKEDIENYKLKKDDVNIYTNSEFVEMFKDKLHNYKKVLPKELKITKREGKVSYMYLPIITFNLGKKLVYANGQTGKLSDKVKYSKLKLFLFSFILFLLTFIVLFIVFKVLK